MPGPKHPPAPEPTAFTADTAELVRGKARQILAKAGLPPSDLDDLGQDIALHVWERLDRLDPDREAAPGAFVRMLVGHAAATVLRGRVRLARRAPASLEALLRVGREPADDQADREDEHGLALDVGAVLASLPADLRRVAETLKIHSVTAAARRLGLSRQAVYRRLEKLRAAFADAGLGDFP